MKNILGTKQFMKDLMFSLYRSDMLIVDGDLSDVVEKK